MRSDLHEVEPLLVRDPLRIVRAHRAEILPLRINECDLTITDLLVYLILFYNGFLLIKLGSKTAQKYLTRYLRNPLQPTAWVRNSSTSCFIVSPRRLIVKRFGDYFKIFSLTSLESFSTKASTVIAPRSPS